MIMKKTIYYLLALLPLLAACSQDEERTEPGSVGGAIRFELFDAGATRAATDGATMVTTFELADKAGLYIVKNGQVLRENVLLTYNSSGFWEASETINADAELSGALFYAYYPYSAEATFDESSATPFADMVQRIEPTAKQSSKAEYEAADIMVSEACSIGQYNAVSLPLNHQKAMVCMELPNVSYIFGNEGMEPYVVSKAENVKFTMGGKAVSPYFDVASQSYRFIVNPGETSTLQTTFSNNGAEQSYETPSLSAIAAGQYAKFVIDGGALLENITLEVGDYYCSDGRIVKADATPLPSNIVGVVFKLGTTEAIRNANSSWSHAVVVSLKETKAKWGTNASTTSAQNAAGWRYWYRDYGLADQNGKTKADQLDLSIMYEEGFEVTKAWRAVPQPLEIGGITLDYTSLMNETYDTWVTNNPAPDNISSNWYFPSLGDWMNIDAQRTIVGQGIAAAEGTALATSQYWSCNVRAAGSNWCYVLGKTANADRFKGVGCSTSVNYRFLLAF